MFSAISSYIPSVTITYNDPPTSVKIPKETIAITAIAVAGIYTAYRLYHVDWGKCLLNIASHFSAYQDEVKKFEMEQEQTIFNGVDTSTIVTTIPENGWDEKDILARLSTIQGTAQNGKNSGAVYINNPELDGLINRIQALAMRTNPLHLSLCPDLRRLETEVVAMTASMFRGDLNVRGNITSGGTLSIAHAVFTMRERAKANGHTSGWRMVVPDTAHPAFDKAANMFGIAIDRAPVHPEGHRNAFRADVEAMRGLINSNTILVVGSFPSFPHGMIDPIEKISEMLQEVDPKGRIGLHVDACLGGFVLPWVTRQTKKIGFEIPRVTSVTACTHKYGYAEKGSSIVLYRNEETYEHQEYFTKEWPGGIYASPTFEGSRPGSTIATTWATMVYFGSQKYRAAAHAIIQTAATIIQRMGNHPHLKILGDPRAMVIAFASKSSELNIYDVHKEMKSRGWYLSPLQKPDAFHLCLTAVHAYNENFANEFMEDLNASVEAAIAYPPELKGKKGEAHIYGTSAMLARYGLGIFFEWIGRRYCLVNARPLPIHSLTLPSNKPVGDS